MERTNVFNSLNFFNIVDLKFKDHAGRRCQQSDIHICCFLLGTLIKYLNIYIVIKGVNKVYLFFLTGGHNGS